VSAPAPALAKPERRTVTVRLADVAVTIAYLSLAFGLLLVFFPVSFPRIILHSWQSGHLIVAMMVVTLSLDAYLYLRIAHRLSARPTVLAAACLGSTPIIVVVGLSFLLQGAVTETLAGDLPNLQSRVGEEILAHTYLGLVSAVFLPFLLIRLLHPFKATSSDRNA
jgi:hypothetical protein